MSLPLVRYVLTAALRDRLIVVLVLSLVVGASLSLFLGSAALTEKTQFVRVFAASGLRLAGLLCLVLFVVSYVRRSFEARDIDYLLSRPIGRVRFILSLSAAFSLLAVIVAAAVSGAALSLAAKGRGVGEGEMLWAVSLAVEYVTMANAAFFFSMVLSGVASSAMAAAGLYVLARLMGQILGIVTTGASLPGAAILSSVMQIISIFVPRLDLMAQSAWIVYGPDGTAGLGFVLAQGLVFSALVVLAACVDLVRRKF